MFGRIRRAAKDLPIAIVVVSDHKDRRAFNDPCRGENRGIHRVVERPVTLGKLMRVEC